MKYYTTDSVLTNYTWEETMRAVWQRYPNPFSKHVLCEDTLERRLVFDDSNENNSGDNSSSTKLSTKSSPKLFTKRLLIKTNPLPKWGQRFVNLRQVAVIEESLLDRDRRTMVTYTRNIGYTSTMNVIEKCIYSPSSSSTTDGIVEEHSSTNIKREAWINSQLRGFASVLQRFGLERYKHNVQQATKGIKYVLTTRLLLSLDQQQYSPMKSTTSIDGAKSKLASMTDRVVHQLENATTAKTKATTGG